MRQIALIAYQASYQISTAYSIQNVDSLGGGRERERLESKGRFHKETFMGTMTSADGTTHPTHFYVIAKA